MTLSLHVKTLLNIQGCVGVVVLPLTLPPTDD